MLFDYLNSLFNLIYPDFCIICSRNLLQNEETICTICEVKLPYTNFHLVKNNPIEKKLWGRVAIQAASSLLYFEKGLEVQKLISHLKYKGREDIGKILGKIYAKKLIVDESEFLKVDLIIPVPLNYKKKKRRGYNQCDEFTISLAQELKIEYNLNAVERVVDTESQTKKSRMSRWENVLNIFYVTKPDALKGKHVLIVDDVITTGATIEALSNKILEIEDTKISILFIASAV